MNDATSQGAICPFAFSFADTGSRPVPGRGFYVRFRLYSPTEPLFDGTWALPDAELT